MKYIIEPTNNAKRVTISARRRGRNVRLFVRYSNDSAIKAEVPLKDLRKALYSTERVTDFSNSKLLRLVRRNRCRIARKPCVEVSLYTEDTNGADLVIVRWKDLAKALYSIRKR